MENLICNDCLNAIRSRGERVMSRGITFSDYDDIETKEDENGEELFECCMCDELVTSTEIQIAEW